MNSITNNKIHLCNSCRSEYPNCGADTNDVMFGDGTGNDNICCCAMYNPYLVEDNDLISRTEVYRLINMYLYAEYSDNKKIDTVDIGNLMTAVENLPSEDAVSRYEYYICKKDLQDANENKKVSYRNLKQKWKVVRKDREEKYHNDMTVEDLTRIAVKYGMDLKINLVPRNQQEENNDNT